MPRVIQSKIRHRALALYLEGNTAPDIVNILKREHEGLSLEPPTIYHWADMGKWKEMRGDSEVTAVAAVVESHTEKLTRMKEQSLTDYENLRAKASNDLDMLDFATAPDAAKALDVALKGQREMMEDMIHADFMQKVIDIIMEEVKDPKIRAAIGIKMRSLINSG
mgnify:CR=1 FL=1